jgi:hypothetical protein
MASCVKPRSTVIDMMNWPGENQNVSWASHSAPNSIVMHAINRAFADRSVRWTGIVSFLLLGLAICIIPWSRPYRGFPIVNLEPKRFPYFWPSKYQWAFRMREVLARGKEITDSGFQVRTMAGRLPSLVLPISLGSGSMVTELRLTSRWTQDSR